MTSEVPPPPISGGTLALDPGGELAVVSDPDRDRVYVVDLAARSVRYSFALPERAEPGRVAVGADGKAYVVLRSSASLVTIDLGSGEYLVNPVCQAPRGVAIDDAEKTLYVTCAGGDLVLLDSTSRAVKRRVEIGRDLRDVVRLGDGRLFVTRFRHAEILELGGDLQTSKVGSLPEENNLAWRAVHVPVEEPPPSDEPAGAETIAVITQEPSKAPVQITPGGYGDGDCSSSALVSTRVNLIGHGSVLLPSAVLPVDLATNGREFVVVAAGNAYIRELPQLFIVQRASLSLGPQGCATTRLGNVPGQAVAAAFDKRDQLVVQSREPAALHIMTEDRSSAWKTITLAEESRADTGHAIFHSNSGSGIACASCHAEGADDGRTWYFIGLGPRRTLSLLGTTPNTEPFHWGGEMTDLRVLVDKVFVERMSGPPVDEAHLQSLANYMFKLPAPPPIRTPANAPAQGKELFEERCSTCHAGPRFTNNRTVNVGTGGIFQVPSLVGVAWRAPYLHNGCASNLFERFNPACGGSKHGQTADLSQAQIASIIAYLETL